ncbi:MAG: hypothetical protein R3C68_00270 [Myxococcota bacterium]
MNDAIARFDTTPLLCLMRFGGLTTLTVLLWLHNNISDEALDFSVVGRFAWVAALYGTVSALMMCVYYRRRTMQPPGNVFFITDVAVFTFAIYLSGVERSWLFFILLVHVADQIYTSRRRVIAFAHLISLAYIGMVFFHWALGHPTDWSLAWVRCSCSMALECTSPLPAWK